MTFRMFQVDAFTARVFTGNPAAVVPLESWLPDATLQAIAAENNLSETAFFVPAAGDGADYDIRWMTPTAEVDLCGHATLASGFVLLELLGHGRDEVRFATRQRGIVSVRKIDQLFWLDFPAMPPEPVDAWPGLGEALGCRPRQILKARDLIAVLDTEQQVRELAPDIDAVARLDAHAVIVTAPGADTDFVSRFFAPRMGIDEDPVTGSAHCQLVPYWSARLKEKLLSARQLSSRGGEIACEDRADRIAIGGQAALYLEGTISL
ncbi:MAG: PhzF family phenazine biosynthesis protein [Phycisphaerales bacterium JB039]